MLAMIRTTTGRENIVIKSLVNRIKSKKILIKSLFYPEDLRGYVFIEGETNDIDDATRGIPHIRGVVKKGISLDKLERFLIPEKREIKLELGDVVEIIGGPFKGEKGKITRVDDAKNEITVEFLEAAIPIPVKIPMNSVRLYKKNQKRDNNEQGSN